MTRSHQPLPHNALILMRSWILITCAIGAVGWSGCGIEPQPGGAPCNSHSDCLSRKCTLSQKPQDGAIGVCTQEQVAGRTQCSDTTFQSYLSCLRGCNTAADGLQCTKQCFQVLPANCQTCLGVVNQCTMSQGCQVGEAGCCEAQIQSCFTLPPQPAAQTPAPQTARCSPQERHNLSLCLNKCPSHDQSCPSGCLLNNASMPCGMCIINYTECMQAQSCQAHDANCCPQWRRTCHGQ